MGYSLDDMIRDSGVSREQIKAGVQAMDEEARAYRLREARRAMDYTQKEVASQAGISQARVSSIERGDLDRSLVGTLRSYLKAIGGTLHISATMPDGTILPLA